jgi:hypothetical protein
MISKFEAGKLCASCETRERFSVDIMIINPNENVVLGIDYFSRKVFGKIITTKEADCVLSFIKNVYKDFRFTTLQCDNGKEFQNEKLRSWCEDNGIFLKFTVPYYHRSNGRIERVNRTIREAIKRTKGSLKQNFTAILANYNNSFHRAIGMSPNEAMCEENFKKVKEKEAAYQKEFVKQRNCKNETLKVKEHVLIKNENRINKMDNIFKECGIVLEALDHDKYLIETENRNNIVRHIFSCEV